MSRCIVLMYHGFGPRPREADPHNLFVTAEDLERQLRLLRRSFRPLDLDGYLTGLASGRWPRRSVLVTIDDGYVSTLEIAAPMLRRFGIPAVLFVPPGRLGGRTVWMPEMSDEQLLDGEGIRALRDHGFEIGAHGMDHSVMSGMGPEELRVHTVEAADALEEIVGIRPRSFAYPVGIFDQAAHEAVRAAGYLVAFSVHEDRGSFGIPRIPVNTRDSIVTFGAKLLPGFQRIERWSVRHSGIRRTAARLLRQRSAE